MIIASIGHENLEDDAQPSLEKAWTSSWLMKLLCGAFRVSGREGEREWRKGILGKAMIRSFCVKEDYKQFNTVGVKNGHRGASHEVAGPFMGRLACLSRGFWTFSISNWKT